MFPFMGQRELLVTCPTFSTWDTRNHSRISGGLLHAEGCAQQQGEGGRRSFVQHVKCDIFVGYRRYIRIEYTINSCIFFPFVYVVVLETTLDTTGGL